jgi:dihydroxyacid dehydratase/phosphogluconate dehydratase
VQNGDLIELDVENKLLNLKIADAEMAKRKAAWQRPPPKYERSYGAIFSRHVTQANEGCDFDFLEGTAPTPEPEIH